MNYSASFTVPGLPANKTAWNTSSDFCYYIYFNIFYPNYVPAGAQYNQFVPQLMLGDALSSSSGPPHYAPAWGTYESYVFSSQYFFSTLDPATNASTLHAVTGPVLPTVPGEVLLTNMSLSSDFVWTLSMSVEGDPARVSTVLVPAPFMGLLPGTSNFSEPFYSKVHFNSCWELYGVDDRGHWPSTGSSFDMRVMAPRPVPWATNFSNGGAIDCPGAPTTSWTERHSKLGQQVNWEIQF